MTGVELKETIRKHKLTYAAFAEQIGVSKSSIDNSVSSNKVSKQVAAAVLLFKENHKLKRRIKKLETLLQEHNT